MRDELGDRMKEFYENRTRIFLPRRTYTIIRIDGKAFHTYTNGLDRPFDEGLVEDMNNTATYLCKKIQGAKYAFVQSDEISVLMTDFDKIGTEAWFGGNVQKIVSVAASMATREFNRLRLRRAIETFGHGDGTATITLEYVDAMRLAEFDARTYTIPSKSEVMNYFIWRQNDCVRNSISIVAQSLYGHKELDGKNMSVQQEMIFQKGQNWNNYPPMLKRGRFVEKQMVELETPFISKEKCQHSYVRNIWTTVECPTFTQDKDFLSSRTLDNL